MNCFAGRWKQAKTRQERRIKRENHKGIEANLPQYVNQTGSIKIKPSERLYYKVSGDFMNSRQRLARQLQTTHHTNDPRQLIELLRIPYSQTKLPASMHGFTCRIGGRIGIIINSQLEESQLAYARAHELGHALLHDHAGHYLISESTFIPPGRYEREADEFAQALLCPEGVSG